MKNDYFHQASDVTGKSTAYTEIDINVSPQIARSKFLEFENWSKWCSVIPEITVKSGDISNLATKPTLDLMLDFGRKGDPAKAPVHPKVFNNTEELFTWGFKLGPLLSAEHVFIFKSINNGSATRLVHYERMKGMFKSLVLNDKMKANMVEKYNTMNEEFKTLCEKSF